MRRQKPVEIEGNTVIVMEMTVPDVMLYIEKIKAEMNGKPDVDKMLLSIFMRSEEYRDIIIRCVKTDISPDEWGVSAWTRIYEAFEEVNDDFFDQCRQGLRVLSAGMTT